MENGAMIFLGTPHRGSDSAVSLHRLLSATVGSKSFIQELMRNSGTLTAINEDFRHHARHLNLWSFHETQPTSIGPGKSMLLVERSSAILGYETEGSSHIDADHHGICKYASPEDPGYCSIKKLIAYILSNIPKELSAHSPVKEERQTGHGEVGVIRRTTRAFLLSIAAQMAIYLPAFYERLIEIDQDHMNIHSMSTRILWQKVFVDTLFELPMDQPWYFVLDALDEAEKPNEVVAYLGKIQSRAQIRILMSSRLGMDLDREFQKLRLSYDVFRQETINSEDTKNDMRAYINRQLETLPFNLEDRQEVISMVLTKSQGIFLWVTLAVEEILATVHSKTGVQEALESMPSEMSDFFQQILDTELQAALKPEFGHLLSLEYTINQVCPHLLKLEETTLLVQPIHATVRDFLLQEPPSEFAVDSGDAHQKLAKITLSIWDENTFTEPISFKTSFSRKHEALTQVQPLLQYSAQSWYEHLQDATVDKNLVICLKHFLRTRVLSWIESVGLLGSLRSLTQAGQVLDRFSLQCPLTIVDRDLFSGWAVDLVRIVPKFGRNITRHPFSIHKLIPPFCPYRTCIGSQFGSNGDIVIVGSAMKKWDDCLAHITVGRDGESCKALVCSDAYLVIALSDSKGAFVVYLAETCEEVRRLNHGERIGAMDMDSTGEQVVTGGLKFIRIWNIKTGTMTAQFENDQGARCLALSFQSDNKKIISIASDNTLSIWDLEKMDRVHVSLAYKGWPIEIWDTNKREISSTIPARNPLLARFNPTSNDVYGVDEDGTLSRFVPETGFQLEIDAQSHVLRCNPNGTLLATGNGEGCLQIFTSDTLDLLYKLDKYDDSITDLAFSPDGNRLYDIRSSDCNVWIPQVLLVNAQKDEASSEESESSRPPISSILESSNSLQSIGSLVSNSTGGVRLDFRLDFRVDGAIRQLLMDDKGQVLLVSSERAASMFALSDGSIIGARRVHSKRESPCWLTHPKDPGTLILFTSEFIKLYSWDDFRELTRPGGIPLVHDSINHGKQWKFENENIRTQAYITHDGLHIVSAMQAVGERTASTQCGFWLVSHFNEKSESIEEVSNINDIYIHSMVGVFRNRAVFLDRELWVCTRAADETGDVTRHFYVPSDWLNTSEERPSIITALGEFIYDKHGELIIVKKGMRCKQDFGDLSLTSF
ncbi:hypothetical protein DL765_003114 [Monosporascus sp. GIB2]|nr:hypothetical protein DL765_003114 [Monosporascus sp. GIB2]